MQGRGIAIQARDVAIQAGDVAIQTGEDAINAGVSCVARLVSRFRGLFILLLMSLTACSSISDHIASSGNADLAPSQPLQVTPGSVQLPPVPLYGDDALSLGAFWSSGQMALQLCDRKLRQLDPDKPLVLSADGEFIYLPSVASDVELPGCTSFLMNAAVLTQLIRAKTLLLRSYFASEVAERRVTGTLSDFQLRPRVFGPQSRLKQFADAVPPAVMKNAVVDG